MASPRESSLKSFKLPSISDLLNQDTIMHETDTSTPPEPSTAELQKLGSLGQNPYRSTINSRGLDTYGRMSQLPQPACKSNGDTGPRPNSPVWNVVNGMTHVIDFPSASDRIRNDLHASSSYDRIGTISPNRTSYGDAINSVSHSDSPLPDLVEGESEYCECLPDDPTRRPRNAFILYRQARQEEVRRNNPGIQNPEISKILGRQWKNEDPSEKTFWCAQAAKEKIAHSKKNPNYKYQPKRNKSSRLDTGICEKCNLPTLKQRAAAKALHAGKTSSPLPQSLVSGARNSPLPHNITGSQDPNIRGTASPRPDRLCASPSLMPLPPRQEDFRPGTELEGPDMKRRRCDEASPIPSTGRMVPTQYAIWNGNLPVGPGTPYPMQTMPYGWSSPSFAHRNPGTGFLPGHMSAGPPMHRPLASAQQGGVVPMDPPQRTIIGYQQHRAAQGHLVQDRAGLTLAPLRDGNVDDIRASSSMASGQLKSLGSATSSLTAYAASPAQVRSGGALRARSFDFRHKLAMLSKVANPASHGSRGPLIAIEGSDPEAVQSLAQWLCEQLHEIKIASPTLLEGPKPDLTHAGKEVAMSSYHRLSGEWLMRSVEIIADLTIKPAKVSDVPHGMNRKREDSRDHSGLADFTPPLSNEETDDELTSSPSSEEGEFRDTRGTSLDVVSPPAKEQQERHRGSTLSTLAVRRRPNLHTEGSGDSSSCTRDSGTPSWGSVEPKQKMPVRNPSATNQRLLPVSVIANYSLYVCNTYAEHIPILEGDPYAPFHHWTWTATQWRGIVGPDLTIYLSGCEKDGQNEDNHCTSAGGGCGGVSMEHIDGSPNLSLIVVKQTCSPETGGPPLDPAVSRRLGFEVAEWVRAFGGMQTGSKGEE